MLKGEQGGSAFGELQAARRNRAGAHLPVIQAIKLRVVHRGNAKVQCEFRENSSFQLLFFS